MLEWTRNMTIASNGHFVGYDQRHSPRTDVYARMPLSLPDGRSPSVTLVNISADGALVRIEQQLGEGSVVALNFPLLGRVAGRVVWSVGGRTGIEFDEQIAMADYVPLLRALGVKTEPAQG
mgnify:CR=1 FL=1